MSNIKIDFSNSKKEIFEILVDGEKFNVEVNLPESLIKKPKSALINNPTDKNAPLILDIPVVEPVFSRGEQGILAPMPGIITNFEKKIGDKVKIGDPVVILEAMKMYNNLYAPCDGVIKSLPFQIGDNVKKFDTLCVIVTD